MQYKQDDIKYKLTDLKQRDSWWQMGFSPALPIARKKITGLFRRLFGILFKFIVYLFNYFSRTPQEILRKTGCHAPLHVQSYLKFCAMYNKHTAAVSTGHKTDRASALQLSSVSQPCATGIVTSEIRRCVEPHKNVSLMP